MTRLPHVVIGGKITLRAWGETFTGWVEETGDWLIKFDEVYIEKEGRELLFPVVVVEEGHSQRFYARITQSKPNEHVSVRLDPMTDPIKTRGVKRSVALLAEQLLQSHKDSQVERHNLQGFLNSAIPAKCPLARKRTLPV